MSFRYAPTSRWGWYLYYVRRFNKYQTEQSATMAMAYLLLHLAFDAPQKPEVEHEDILRDV